MRSVVKILSTRRPSTSVLAYKAKMEGIENLDLERKKSDKGCRHPECQEPESLKESDSESPKRQCHGRRSVSFEPSVMVIDQGGRIYETIDRKEFLSHLHSTPEESTRSVERENGIGDGENVLGGLDVPEIMEPVVVTDENGTCNGLSEIDYCKSPSSEFYFSPSSSSRYDSDRSPLYLFSSPSESSYHSDPERSPSPMPKESIWTPIYMGRQSQPDSVILGSDDEEQEDVCDYKRGGYHPVELGDLYNERYRVLRKLGWGQFSTVWLCEDKTTRTHVALKIMRSSKSYTETALDEIRLLKFVNSNGRGNPKAWNVVQLLDNFKVRGVNGNHVCLVFEVLGKNLLKLLIRSDYEGISIRNVKRIIRQLLEALDYLHVSCDIIHTDVKPENILMCVTDEEIETLAANAAKLLPPLPVAEPQERQLGFPTYSPAVLDLPSLLKKDHSATRDDHAFKKIRLTPAEAFDSNSNDSNTNEASFSSYDSDSQDAVRAQVDKILENGKLFETPEDSPEENATSNGHDEKDNEGENALSVDTPESGAGEAAAVAIPAAEPFTAARFGGTSVLVFQPKAESQDIFNGFETFHHSETAAMTPPPSPADELKNAAHKPVICTASWVNPGSADGRSVGMYNRTMGIQKDVNVKLADLGNACYCGKPFTDRIQTRQYRAVEVLLGAAYGTAVDIWSVACLAFEIATGDYLFEPQKGNTYSRGEDHLGQMIDLLGPIPSHVLDRGKYRGDFFDKDGNLRNIPKDKMKPWPLVKVLTEKYNWKVEAAEEFASFLLPMLNFDDKERATAAQCLEHPWLAE